MKQISSASKADKLLWIYRTVSEGTITIRGIRGSADCPVSESSLILYLAEGVSLGFLRVTVKGGKRGLPSTWGVTKAGTDFLAAEASLATYKDNPLSAVMRTTTKQGIRIMFGSLSEVNSRRSYPPTLPSVAVQTFMAKAWAGPPCR